MNKQISYLLILIHCAITATAQLQELEPTSTKWTTVGEVKWLANTKASLKYFVSANDTTYLLYMQDEQRLKNSRDMTVRKYFSISFSGADNTVGKLYGLLISFFNENRGDKKYEKIFKLGNEMVIVRHYPGLTTSISFSTKQSSIVFKEKEVKKLFDR